MGSRNCLLLFCITAVLSSCASNTKLYFVRHAEKGTIPARDPDLTPDGMLRAQSLARLLRNNGIAAIYSTDTRRTRQTAEPLSTLTGRPIRLYSNDTTQKFLYRLLERDENALVVGHSNTVLLMLKEIGVQPSAVTIADDDYDNLFVVTIGTKNGTGEISLHLRERTYGKKSPASSDTASRKSSMH